MTPTLQRTLATIRRRYRSFSNVVGVYKLRLSGATTVLERVAGQ